MEAGIPISSSLVACAVDRRLTVLLFILPVGLLLLAALAINHGQLTYTLDDAYIHIDLARQIFNGSVIFTLPVICHLLSRRKPLALLLSVTGLVALNNRHYVLDPWGLGSKA